MDLKNLTDKAKELIERRGGTESLKEDAGELKDIASSKDSLADKAKDAVEAIKDPGDDSEPPRRRRPPTRRRPTPRRPEAERGGKRGRETGEARPRRPGRGGRGGGRGGGRDGDPAV